MPPVLVEDGRRDGAMFQNILITGASSGIGEALALGYAAAGVSLALTGREDDVVKVDGKRVALGEVEGCLEAFPKIKAAQATVVTDPMAGAMVVARVVMKQQCGAEEIIDHCARNLAPYKVPRRIEFCDVI